MPTKDRVRQDVVSILTTFTGKSANQITDTQTLQGDLQF